MINMQLQSGPSRLQLSKVGRWIKGLANSVIIVVGVLLSVVHAGDSESLVVSKPGNLPIILTAPHGGEDNVTGANVRTRGTSVTDTGTFQLTEALAKRLSAMLGAEPYVVAARFSRKYIDANRAEADAFESLSAAAVYWAYHNQIRSFVNEIKRKFPNGGILLDIHGQSDDPSIIHRGTRNGKTVAALIKRHGDAALIGPTSIAGVLQSKGYELFPPNTPIGDPSENKRFIGGHTVFIYGSNNLDGIDAIQLEVGKRIRSDSTFVDNLAEAIVIFYKTYLVGNPRAQLLPSDDVNNFMTYRSFSTFRENGGTKVPFTFVSMSLSSEH